MIAFVHETRSCSFLWNRNFVICSGLDYRALWLRLEKTCNLSIYIYIYSSLGILNTCRQQFPTPRIVSQYHHRKNWPLTSFPFSLEMRDMNWLTSFPFSLEMRDMNWLTSFPFSLEMRDMNWLTSFPFSLEMRDMNWLTSFPFSLEMRDIRIGLPHSLSL